MNLVFHQGALSGFALTLPLLRALPGPTTAVLPWSRGRFAAALIEDLSVADLDQFEFTRLHTESGPSTLSPAVADLFAAATHLIDFIGRPGDAWTVNLQRLIPHAGYTAMPAGREPGPGPASVTEHVTQLHRRLLIDAGLALADPRFFTRPAPPADGPALLHLGSGDPVRSWPVEHGLALADRLRAAGATPQMVFGPAEAERWTAAQRERLVAAGARGFASLEALVEALLAARLYVGHDTGPTHLASQLGVPTLALFGPTDPRVWAPAGPDVVVLAPPTPGPVDTLAVDAVAERASAMLHSGVAG